MSTRSRSRAVKGSIERAKQNALTISRLAKENAEILYNLHPPRNRAMMATRMINELAGAIHQEAMMVIVRLEQEHAKEHDDV